MKPDNQQDISKVPPQLQPHVFKKGQSGNLKGRPVGKSLKEYSREYLAKMNEEERNDFLEGLPKEAIWKMAEGNPAQDSSATLEITMPTPIMKLDDVQRDDSNKEDSKAEKKD